jgi:hypothetical protein
LERLSVLEKASTLLSVGKAGVKNSNKWFSR